MVGENKKSAWSVFKQHFMAAFEKRLDDLIASAKPRPEVRASDDGGDVAKRCEEKRKLAEAHKAFENYRW